jgi:hypothetical protein
MGASEGSGRTRENCSEVTGTLSRETVVVDIKHREALLVVLLVVEHARCVHVCSAL